MISDFNAEQARKLVVEFSLKEEAKAKAQIPEVIIKIEKAATRGQSHLMLELNYKYVKAISDELKRLGFAIKMDSQSRDSGDSGDSIYTISWGSQ